MKGFVKFTDSERSNFARASVWEQTAYDRVKQPKPHKTFILSPSTILVSESDIVIVGSDNKKLSLDFNSRKILLEKYKEKIVSILN